jgi:hypothetical protein
MPQRVPIPVDEERGGTASRTLVLDTLRQGWDGIHRNLESKLRLAETGDHLAG